MKNYCRCCGVDISGLPAQSRYCKSKECQNYRLNEKNKRYLKKKRSKK